MEGPLWKRVDSNVQEADKAIEEVDMEEEGRELEDNDSQPQIKRSEIYFHISQTLLECSILTVSLSISSMQVFTLNSAAAVGQTWKKRNQRKKRHPGRRRNGNMKKEMPRLTLPPAVNLVRQQIEVLQHLY